MKWFKLYCQHSKFAKEAKLLNDWIVNFSSPLPPCFPTSCQAFPPTLKIANLLNDWIVSPWSPLHSPPLPVFPASCQAFPPAHCSHIHFSRLPLLHCSLSAPPLDFPVLLCSLSSPRLDFTLLLCLCLSLSSPWRVDLPSPWNQNEVWYSSTSE